MTEATTRAHSGTKRRAQDVALELFSRDGYDSTSMREIAEELGVTKAALYYHFKGKEDIVRSIVEDFGESMDALVEWADQEPHPAPQEVLTRWAGVVRSDGLRFIRFMQANQRIARDLELDGKSLRDRLMPLVGTLTAGDESLEARIRGLLALFALQGVGALSSQLDATEDEAFAIGFRVATEILAGPHPS